MPPIPAGSKWVLSIESEDEDEPTTTSTVDPTLLATPISGGTSSAVMALVRAPRLLRREGVIKSDDFLDLKGIMGSQADREVFAGLLAKMLGLADAVPRATTCRVALADATTTSTSHSTTQRFSFVPFVKGKSFGQSLPMSTEELISQAAQLVAFELIVGNADLHEENLFYGSFPRSPVMEEPDEKEQGMTMTKPRGKFLLPAVVETNNNNNNTNNHRNGADRMRLVAIDHGLSMGQRAPQSEDLQFCDVFRLFNSPFLPSAVAVIARAKEYLPYIEEVAFAILGKDKNTEAAVALLKRRVEILCNAIANELTVGEAVEAVFSASVDESESCSDESYRDESCRDESCSDESCRDESCGDESCRDESCSVVEIEQHEIEQQEIEQREIEQAIDVNVEQVDERDSTEVGFVGHLLHLLALYPRPQPQPQPQPQPSPAAEAPVCTQRRQQHHRQSSRSRGQRDSWKQHPPHPQQQQQHQPCVSLVTMIVISCVSANRESADEDEDEKKVAGDDDGDIMINNPTKKRDLAAVPHILRFTGMIQRYLFVAM